MIDGVLQEGFVEFVVLLYYYLWLYTQDNNPIRMQQYVTQSSLFVKIQRRCRLEYSVR